MMGSNWKENKELLTTALEKVEEIEKMLGENFSLSSLKTFRNDLSMTASFYNFLLTTQMPIFSSEMGYFSVLPEEVIQTIFSHMNLQSLCRIYRVCKLFKRLADDEAIWQHMCQKLVLIPRPEKRSWKWFCKSEMCLFKEGEQKNGPGTYKWPCKSTEKGKHENKYSGDWMEDKRHGFGTYHWCNGSMYTGEWKDDRRDGSGIRVWPNGNKYVGEYKNHKRHGNGEFTFSNGSIFKGNFEENKFIFGTYKWPNGRIYKGEWNNIYRHGKGTYWWPDGRSYDGEWKNDKRHGRGSYSWPDGDCYDGLFIDGKRWGRGTLCCRNGEIYDQEWKEDRFNEFNKGLPTENETEPNPQIITKKRKKFRDRRF